MSHHAIYPNDAIFFHLHIQVDDRGGYVLWDPGAIGFVEILHGRTVSNRSNQCEENLMSIYLVTRMEHHKSLSVKH